jgi:hypothetical protein
LQILQFIHKILKYSKEFITMKAALRICLILVITLSNILIIKAGVLTPGKKLNYLCDGNQILQYLY